MSSASLPFTAHFAKLIRVQLPMNVIDIFDVSSYYDASTPNGTWYKQNTTGDTPPGRIDFCLAVVSALDGSSHNM